MKKNLLALSITAMIGGLGLAGAANAAVPVLNVAESGTGHILVMPYYNAQNGNMSVFHLTNTDTINGKAVKVRFRGASNSDDVLDFQVFLSPGDVWTAAVTQGADGRAQLATADTSCTLPQIPAGGVSFVTDRLTKPGWTATDKAVQTLEGYVEVLNMSDIQPGSALFKATKHVSGAGTAPCTAAVLNDTLNVTPVVNNAATYTLPAYPANATNGNGNDLAVPTGGLTGQWYIQNVAQTTTFSGTASAVKPVVAPVNLFSPQKTGAAVLTTADPLMVAGFVAAQHYDVPDLSTPFGANTAAEQAVGLTGALAHSAVMNQYATDAGVFAKTDWVFSMPTRRYSIAANYAALPVGTTKAADTSAVGPVVPAADTYRVINADVRAAGANIFTTAGNTSVNGSGQICVTAATSTFYDREERFQQDGAVFSPGTPTKVQLCGEVSVMAFSADASVLGATVARQNVSAPYTNGWGAVNFGAGAVVPVLGASFVKLQNANATPGVSGTYGINWAHSYN